MMETLSTLGVKPDIIDLIHKGTELEDFSAFLSMMIQLQSVYKELEELLKQYKM